MKSWHFEIHRRVARYFPDWIIRFYFRYFVPEKHLDQIIGMGKQASAIANVMKGDKPVFLRDDLVCMMCPRPDSEAEEIAHMERISKLRHGTEMPFMMYINTDTQQMTILCHDCYDIEHPQHIPKDELVKGVVYEVKARNFTEAEWLGDAFEGYRTKYGQTFKDKEYHWDDEKFGTVKPIRPLREGPL